MVRQTVIDKNEPVLCSKIEMVTINQYHPYYPRRVEVSRGSEAFGADGVLADMGPRVKLSNISTYYRTYIIPCSYLFHIVPKKPGFPYESCNDERLSTLAGSLGRLSISRLPKRWVVDDCVVLVLYRHSGRSTVRMLAYPPTSIWRRGLCH